MTLAIAADREEEIGSYLKTCGFWEKDLCASDYDEISADRFDRTDLLIIYAHKYKEALLDAWAAEDKTTDPQTYRAIAAEQFSFIALLMTINREIQFVSSQIKLMDEKPSSIRENQLVMPVRNSSRMWAKGSSIYT